MAVYFVQRPLRDFDLTPAHRYGAVEFLFEDPTFQPSIEGRKAVNILYEKFKDFDPQEDYIVAAGGDPLGPVLVGMVLREKFPTDVIRGLRYDRMRGITGGVYTPVLLSI